MAGPPQGSVLAAAQASFGEDRQLRRASVPKGKVTPQAGVLQQCRLMVTSNGLCFINAEVDSSCDPDMVAGLKE